MPKKSGKTDNVIKLVVATIGLVGTIVAAILTNPALITSLGRTPMSITTSLVEPTPSDTTALIFSENFNDGNASGLAYGYGDWEILKDRNEYVLEGIADQSLELDEKQADVTFGPSSLKDGIVAFRFKFIQPGSLLVNFRSSEKGQYSLYLIFTDEVIILGYGESGTGWHLEYESENMQYFTFQENVWYQARLEFDGDTMDVDIDDNWITSLTDSRFSAGRLVFALDPGTQVHLDDIEVWSIDR